MSKLLLCDIDGVLLPANPDPSLPYMRRLVYLRELCEKYRRNKGNSPIDDKSIAEDNLNKRETTDLGYVMTLLYPDHHPFSHEFVDLLDIVHDSEDLIRDSMDFYNKLLSYSNQLRYEPNPGVKEFLTECKNNGWTLKITSGNPYRLTVSKLHLSGLLDFFRDGDQPFLDINLGYGEHAWFRDQMIEDAMNRNYLATTVYMGDRESDIGSVARVSGLRGIIIPSFSPERLHLTEIKDLIDSKRILVLEDLADKSSRSQALNFMESNTQGKETRLPLTARK